MLGIDDGFVVPDDGVNVLEENDPGHNGMGEAGLGGFFVMFAKVSRGMEELFREDGSFELDFGRLIYDRLAVDAAEVAVAAAVLREIEGAARCVETGIATFEECTHVGRDERVREAFEGRLALHFLQVKRGGGVEVDDLTVSR